LILALVAVLGPALCSAQTAGTTEAARPRIGLVLSGGGARGAAHVGVLKVLDEMHIPIDAIAGTSMGAVVGGLYASGMSARDIEKLITSVNWQDAFQDRPPRAELGYRRKQDDRNFLVRYALGVRKDGLILPRGLVQGQKLEQVLRSAALPVADVQDFDRLPIPFRAIATDLETGEAVLMRSGDLVTAMRASMSAPAVFAPSQRDGHLLVDGGLTENLPVDAARQMGVDVLIVVDVSFPLYERDQLTSPLEVTNQAFAILIRSHTLEQRKKLLPTDIVIDPPLGKLASADFTRVPQTLRAGEDAARASSGVLAALSLSPQDYQRYLAARNPRMTKAPVIQFVRADSESGAYADLIAATMADAVGKPLDQKVMQQQLSALYALDLFESIDYAVVKEGDLTGLEMKLRRKSWGPNYVRFGLNLEDDFEGNSRYNAAARFVMTELNALGAEWVTDLQIGESPRLSSEFYQPLTLASRYFVAPRVNLEEHSVFGPDRIAEYRIRNYEAGLDVGRELSNWGEVRVGVHRGSGHSRVLIGDRSLGTEDFNSGGAFARFSYDKLDSLYFPRRGQQFEMEWRGERTDFGADENFDVFTMSYLIARSIDRHTFIFSTDMGTTIDAVPKPSNFFTLGGFFNLSGLAPGSLSGPHFGIARFLYYRKIGKGGTGILDLPAYAGVSLEAGNAWLDRHDASFNDLHKDASLFFGLDTPLGPVYLAAGFDEGGDRAFYLFLGRTF
jgi:NTE family protein